MPTLSAMLRLQHNMLHEHWKSSFEPHVVLVHFPASMFDWQHMSTKTLSMQALCCIVKIRNNCGSKIVSSDCRVTLKFKLLSKPNFSSMPAIAMIQLLSKICKEYLYVSSKMSSQAM